MRRIIILLAFLIAYTEIIAAEKDNSCDTKTISVPGLSDRIQFSDHKHYLLIRNNISGQQYIYWKRNSHLDVVKVDSNMIKNIYLEFKKDTAACIEYMSLMRQAQFKPKIMSLAAYDDTTVLACLETYEPDTIIDQTQLFIRVYSVLEIGIRAPVKLFYVNKALPVANNCLQSTIHADKRTLYFSLFPDIDYAANDHNRLYNLARMKKLGTVYNVDKVMPSTINDYLVTNEVFDNYNEFYLNNGYALMSLSNYVLNLQTGERISLPFADSIFRNIRIDPKTYGIPYYVSDFKFNKAEGKFYLSYYLHRRSYIASFRPHATAFDTNDFTYTLDGDFCQNMKNECLSWDGRHVLYSMKGDSCFRYATPVELQKIAQEYQKQ